MFSFFHAATCASETVRLKGILGKLHLACSAVYQDTKILLGEREDGVIIGGLVCVCVLMGYAESVRFLNGSIGLSLFLFSAAYADPHPLGCKGTCGITRLL